MLNRWQGNTGKVERIDEGKMRPGKPEHIGKTPPQPMSVREKRGSIMDSISKILPGTAQPLDEEDLILLLILYLMYRESGDTELLIIMGAMFLL